ncbi:3-phosphoshikimate 1-carboxyvinyltransferase [Fusobacterium pseudoperiodonticum]|uniref:3-phosphoshikimate 1-carboxyvinyltransferase n=1 Tax=Fusobacterium pseudoperiodonticum TaxID=2663009 RepID=A0AAD0AMZ9_9FUSO|nr:3-phosphoshikimate 1-carboxyvinyltransferase [Fusobacterium pseudoperiodonticum]ATV35002.1 3-phosphoshikimate 1-carboxyvinyltransferase [Fusobacterium pseudoperiodonticum]ATV62104.1 3-phosphoshikimate 1-carboxyvinyltransferase [Fusobacterium pseudoperiodonticum]
MKIIKVDKLVGELSPPPSKSVLHRYIIASSLAKGISKIENISFSEDIIATIEAMKKLGAKIEQKDNYLLIDGSDTFKNLNENIEIDCNESGSTLRFLFPLSIVKENKVLFKGRGKLFKRPMTPYFKNFEKFKIKHSYIDENAILLEGQLKAGIYEIDGNISSQFITGLLFSLPLLDGESKIIINGKLESSNYIDISLDCLSKFGIKIINNSYQEFIIEGNQSYKVGNYRTEADYSQAAFFLVANAIGSKIKINDLSEDSLQGDKKIIDYISEIDNWNSKDTLVLDGSETPDIIPILSLKAAVSGKKIEIVNVERLRIKESDRLKATVEELSKLNFDLIEKKDSILINSRENFEANKNEKIVSLSAHSDHRIAMMIAIAATCYDGEILLDNLDCVKKSYPNFWEVFLSLGGKIYEYLGN